MCGRAENQNKISAEPISMTSVELLKNIKINYIKIIGIS